MGVACLLASQVRREVENGSLVVVLKDWSPSVPPNYIYDPSKRLNSAALRTFVNAIRVGAVQKDDP